MSQGEMDPDDLRRTITYKKRNFTRHFNALGKLTAFADTHPSPYAVQEIEHTHTKLRRAFGELTDALDVYLDVEPNFDKEHDQLAQEAQDRYEQMVERTLASLQTITTPAATTPATAPPAATAGANIHPRLMETLKPPVLTKDFNPVEFKSWVKKFKAYYSTGKVEQMKCVDQQAIWRICIDPDLEEKISDQMTDDTPIFGIGGVMELLSDEFETKYPLTTRRADYFRLTQKEDQQFSDHMAKLLRIAREADLADLSVEDLHCFRLISSVTDKKLREKFLKLEEPTLPELVKVVKAYERVQATCNALDGEDPQSTVKKVSQSPYKKEKMGRNKEPKSGIDDSKDKKRNTQCYTCGALDHIRTACKLKDAKCNFCKRKGHVEAVCKTKMWKQAASSHSPTKDGSAKKLTNDGSASDTDNEEEEEEGAQASRIFHRVSSLKTYTQDTPRLLSLIHI